jgi:hypothetical protein
MFDCRDFHARIIADRRRQHGIGNRIPTGRHNIVTIRDICPMEYDAGIQSRWP